MGMVSVGQNICVEVMYDCTDLKILELLCIRLCQQLFIHYPNLLVCNTFTESRIRSFMKVPHCWFELLLGSLLKTIVWLG